MSDSSGTANIVTNKFVTAQNYASDAWRAAEEFLAQLGRISRLDYPHARIAAAPEDPGFPDIPAPPEFPEVAVAGVDAPQAPSLEDIVLEEIPIPEFTIIPPDILIPEPPDLDWPEAPDGPPTPADIALPPDPEYVLPDPPVFDSLDIPAMPGVIIPAFEGERPPVPGFVAPGNLFVHHEAGYVSPLGEALSARVQKDLELGGTGLAPEVEDALWERGRNRLARELETRVREIGDRFAAAGCVAPGGPMLALIRQVQAEHAEKLADLSRDIGIKQAEMAREQGRFAVDTAVALETRNIELFNAVAARAFERAQAVARFGYEALDAEINIHNAQMARYQADAAVFETRVRASLAELEQYKTRMEGTRLAAEVQGVAAQVYKVQLDGVTALVETYKARMQGVAAKADLERQRLLAHEAAVQAYVAGVNAQTARLNAHAAHIAGEKAKAEVYADQVKAWVERVAALREQSQARLAAGTETAKIRLEKYRADVAGYEARVRTAVAQAETLLRGGEGDLRAYEALVKAKGLETDAKAREYASRVDAYMKTAEVSLKEADMLLQSALGEMRLEVEKIRSGAQVSAQMAASALSSVNASAQIGYSESKGERTNSSVTESTQRSTSEATSRSTGYRESISHNYNYRN
ncbi:hypothetical protein [Desulfolutivibrio sulfoxidireducens]|uniref:hypothetical protein n=1 Tax=Desulfolutivibrio sulfoxidireducens TaxID=2773299 RepID=UPI00159E9878|nr:hypothetical protein [Desulfolutivibrio sulfoxidireducens]QLA17695.1 hypothetical protein GD605_17230 [Desulfolutivibrio sulfoxidireducens]